MRKYVFAILGIVALVVMSCEPNNGKEPIIPTQPQDSVAKVANSMVIYECNERLFAQDNAFKAIENYVPTLKEMGVNVLWLMPIHPRGEGDKSIGSPYCVKNYTAIDPKFGTMEDLKSLVETCHANDMRVILDWIANHTAWDNSWTTTHPDWYQGPSTADEQNWKDVTFLNFSKQAVCDTMKQCMLYWVKEADIDGFRCDYAHGVPLTFWHDVNEDILSIKPNALLLAETSDTRHYDAGFELLYSWNYLYAIEDYFQGTGTFNSLLSAHNSEYKSTPAGKERMRYITTHDETATKAPGTIYRTAEGELSAFCLTIFMGGVPMIYSSQELGYMNKISFFEYNILDFYTANATRNALIDIMEAYHATKDLRAGEQILSTLATDVPYVEYTKGNKALLVICNTAGSERTVKLPMRYTGAKVHDLISGETKTLGAVATLQPREYLICTK